MDSYIIRIYRRDSTRTERIEGVVEKVGGKKTASFHSATELTGILTKRRSGKAGRSRTRQDTSRRE